MGVFRAILPLVIIVSHFSQVKSSTSTGELGSKSPSDDQQNKLDRIVESLDSLSVKLDQLSRNFDKHCNCQRVTLNKANSPPVAAALTSSNRSNVHNNSNGESSNQLLASTSSKDLFHFNNLAPNLNTIQTDQFNWPTSEQANSNQENGNHEDSVNFSTWFHSNDDASGGGGRDDTSSKWAKRFQLMLSQQYELMFGSALDNLTSVTKEQLTNFRLTLNKLMNRFLDQSYQYNSIVSQLSIIKDECSLAASSSSSSSNLVSPKTGSHSSTETPEEVGTYTQQPTTATLRLSDITMIVRLVSSELSQLIRDRLPTNSVVCTDHDASSDKSVETILKDKDFKPLLNKLDEIGSVVKQSALLLTKLYEQKSIGSGNKTETNFSEISFSNENESNLSSGEIKFHEQQSSRQPNTSSRWFSGSKVPGKNKTQMANPSSTSQSQQTNSRSLNCQSKTSLATPASCRQLRMAGANCTGQYYVFVRGSIRHIYCDMNMDSDDDGGGWTVILRRIDKTLTNHETGQARAGASGHTTNPLVEFIRKSQVDFNLDWSIYKQGFGQLNDWSEFFIGLDFLHQLTSGGSGLHSLGVNQTEMQIDLTFNDTSELHLRFDEFKVGNEESRYELTIGGCNSSVELCGPMIGLNGAKFDTFERRVGCRPTGAENQANSESVSGGWWVMGGGGGELKKCSSDVATFRLTQPMGRQQAANGEIRHLYWPTVGANLTPATSNKSQTPVKQLVVKIRRKRVVGSSLWLSV